MTGALGQEDNSCQFVEPEILLSRLTAFFAAKNLDVRKPQLVELFQHFELNADRQVNIEQAVHCLFTESYHEFVERHNQNLRSMSLSMPDNCYKENTDPNLQTGTSLKQGGGYLPAIKKLEAKTILKNKGLYATFKEIDVDKDGFLSKKDFQKFLQNNSGCSETEARHLLEFFGQCEGGLVSFPAFASRLHIDDKHAPLAEVNGTTNILGLKQFDAKEYLRAFPSRLEKMERERDKFRLTDPKDNCEITSLLGEEQV